MIDISELMTDPDFTRPYVLRRPTGAWVGDGVWQESHDNILRTGAIQPASAQDAVQFLPEGERTVRAIRVWDKQDIHASETPDIILTDGKSYRVAFAKLWYANGYYFAVATEFKDGY